MSFGEYGEDALVGDWRGAKSRKPREVFAHRDLVVEWADSGFCGAVLGLEGKLVRLEDYSGGIRLFPLGGGYLLEGEPIVLRAPLGTPTSSARTASGSFAAPEQRARVALPSRIFVEGRHDAELVEKVWGADLRLEGVVVEYLEGINDLAAIVSEFAPGPGRRIGVLVDHLVPGSKESRIADAVAAGPFGASVLVVGHPFVDIWQAVKPARLGLHAWPLIPRSIEWKHGICSALGWPHADQTDIAGAWQRILARVRTYADLEPVVLGRVEELIDFVTCEPNGLLL